MNDFVILTDSSCDLSADMAEKLGVLILPMGVTLEGKTYANYPDEREIKNKDFYQRLSSGAMATTSAISPAQLSAAVTPILAGGKDVLYLAFSSALSSTCTSARVCARELNEKYDHQLLVVDTLAASLGEGLIVYYAAQERAKGKRIEEVRDFVEGMRLELCHWFTVDDLFHLKRGGRVSATTAVVGTLLNIKPVLHVDNEGRLINVGKARGRVASIRALIEHMKATAIDPENQTIFISHGDCADDVQVLKDLLNQEIHPKEIYVNYIGPVIGAHSGPGTLALFFRGTER